MGCLTFETAVENKSLAAFSLLVISGDSPFYAQLIPYTAQKLHMPRLYKTQNYKILFMRMIYIMTNQSVVVYR